MDDTTIGKEHNGAAPRGAPAARAYATRMDLQELERQVERGSLFAQATFQRGFSRIGDAEALLTRLIEALTNKGVVTDEEIGVRWEDPPAPDDGDGPAPIPSPFSATKPPEDPEPSREGVRLVDPTTDESTGIVWPAISIRIDDPEGLLDPDPDIDCDARMHVCHAVCCSLKFPLSEPEIDRGVVKWDIGHPYVIRHNTHGMCVHNDPSNGGCTVYEDRPRICRRYSCVRDTRIWKDFDNMVLNEEWIAANMGSRDIHVGAVLPTMDPSEIWGPGDVYGGNEIS